MKTPLSFEHFLNFDPKVKICMKYRKNLYTRTYYFTILNLITGTFQLNSADIFVLIALSDACLEHGSTVLFQFHYQMIQRTHFHIVSCNTADQSTVVRVTASVSLLVNHRYLVSGHWPGLALHVNTTRAIPNIHWINIILTPLEPLGSWFVYTNTDEQTLAILRSCVQQGKPKWLR